MKHIIKTVELEEDDRPLIATSYCGLVVHEDSSVKPENINTVKNLCKSCGGIYGKLQR